jgi:DUF4097 and DUF4098 domain-containing protein YvlB
VTLPTLLAVLVAAGAIQTDTRSPQTDETIPVSRGARLTLVHFAGEVNVRAWDRDALRVQARHASRARVDVQSTPASVRVSASNARGGIGSVDYEISAPAWMPVTIEGHYSFVVVEGMQADVAVETVRGDVSVKGGASISARSVEGAVAVEGATRRVIASSVNKGVTVTAARGDVAAETVNGPIALTRMDASAVEATTVNGSITFDGTAAAGSQHRLTTHNGNVTLSLPENTHATFAVRTYNGSFSSALGTTTHGESTRGRRTLHTVGNGSAAFEIETFSGSIRLRKAGTAASSPKDPKQHER